MARPKQGIIYSLEAVLAKLLETNEALDERLAQLEAVLVGHSMRDLLSWKQCWLVVLFQGKEAGSQAGHGRIREEESHQTRFARSKIVAGLIMPRVFVPATTRQRG